MITEEKLDFLRSIPAFEALTDIELEDLAKITDAYAFERGSVIAYQREVADRAFIVKSGRLEVFEMDNTDSVTRAKRVMSGDILEELWLVEQGVIWGTIRAATDGEMYTIRYEEFLLFVGDHPSAILDLTADTWAELDRSMASDKTPAPTRLNLSPDELIEYESRRTGLLLLVQLIPALFMTLLFPFGVWFLSGLLNLGLLTPARLATLMTLAVIPGILYGIYKYFDWANDYLLITNKHLIHREFDLGALSGEVLKIPLDQVQSIKLLRPNPIETVLGVGTVQITTAASAKGLKFDYIRQPQEVEKTINIIRQKERTLDAGRTRKEMREMLEGHFSVNPQLDEIDVHDSEEAKAAQARRRRRLRRRGNRVETADAITYGRHWIVFVQEAWWLIFITFLTVVGGIFWVTQFGLSTVFGVVMLLGLMAETIGLYFFYEDWTNDLFQVTGDTVIDIDRGPFGFTESRKTAPLANVQNVRAEQKNILATILGYGDVVVDTAGASADIVFENVKNPQQVQTDIFHKRDLLKSKSRQKDAVVRYQENALFLDEYQQLGEQGKIPRRTPFRAAEVREDGEVAFHKRNDKSQT